MRFLPYQRQYLRASNSCIVMKARQVGLTTMAAMKAVSRRLQNTRLGRRNLYYSATDETLAKDFIRVCLEWIERFGVKLFVEPTSTCITLPFGATINAVSSNPKALRGKPDADAIIDEFAFHEDGEALLSRSSRTRPGADGWN